MITEIDKIINKWNEEYHSVTSLLSSRDILTGAITEATAPLTQRVKELETLLAYKDETATTFMNQVKKLQARVAELEADQRRLDWCESHLLSLVDGGGAYIIEHGPVDSPIRLDEVDGHCLGGIRQAIDAAMPPPQSGENGGADK